MAWTYEYYCSRLGVTFKQGDRFIVKGKGYKSAYSDAVLTYDYTNEPTEKAFYGVYSDPANAANITHPILFMDTSGSKQHYIDDSAIYQNVSGTQMYHLDLNFIVNGTTTENASMAKADVYINGTKVASGVGDYWKQHPKGSTYEIKNIVVASGYSIYNQPTLSGTLNAKTAVNIYIGQNYTFSFNANGGSGAPSSATKTYGVAFTFPTTKPTRTGYTFAGWYNDNVNSGKVYSAGTQYTDLPDSNYTFYAKWTANTYAVKFNGNGSTSGSMSNQSFTYDKSQALTANAFKRAYTVTYNYNGSGASNTTATATSTFNGWATSASGSKVYNDKQSVSNLATSGTYNLYANWTLGKVTLPTPTRTGYTFNGWYTAASGGTKVGAGGASYTPSATVTLYAQWTAITYSVKYNANNGSGSMSNSSHTYDTAKALTTNAFTRTGYTFNGWNTKADGTGTSYVDKASVKNLTSTSGGTVNLYAQWKINSYTLTINPNGGTWNSTTSNSTATQNYGTTKTIANPTRTGYTFGGWTLSGSGSLSGTTYTYGAGAGTLTAKWTVNQYTYNIVYKSSSGTQLGTATAKYNYGTTNSISPKSYTGYTSPAAQSVKWDSTSAKTITFTYTPISYTLSYTLNSGSVRTANKTSYTIETATFTLNNPIREGYKFTGWTGSNGTTASKSVSIAKGSTGNKSYTANWTALSAKEKEVYIYKDGTIEAALFLTSTSKHGFYNTGAVYAKEFVTASSNWGIDSDGKMYFKTFKEKTF